MKRKIEAWSKTPARDSNALREFSDFLGKCCAKKKDIPSLSSSDDISEINNVSYWLVTNWVREVYYNYKE